MPGSVAQWAQLTQRLAVVCHGCQLELTAYQVMDRPPFCHCDALIEDQARRDKRWRDHFGLLAVVMEST